MKIIFLGDICAKPGRQAIFDHMERLRERYEPDFIIANAENAAGGFGLTPSVATELLTKVDCLTLGDHFLDRKELIPFLETETRILRPLNLPPGAPGHGYQIFNRNGKKIAVVNLLGRVFLRPVDCPFQKIREVLFSLREKTKVIVVDFHAEATAEKVAMGWFLDGEVSAVIGTHTHVPTADERILPKGTAYITDIGMCGALDSVLGMKIETSLRRILTGLPYRLEPATTNIKLLGVYLEIEEETGRANLIKRIQEPEDV
ncbi:MAG: TIGR00282 family metallophosphoesterase [candidate division WOR-3 bacterium]